MTLSSKLTALFLFAFLAGNFATPPLAHAQDNFITEVKSLPASVHRVISGGYWSRGKEEGFFRVVVISGGVEHVSHLLYLQWLKINADTQGYNVVRTRAVKEINDGHGYILDVKADYSEFEYLKLTVDARGERPQRKTRFIITVKGDGTYAVKRSGS